MVSETWENSIRMGVNTRDWNYSAQDRDYCRILVNETLK